MVITDKSGVLNVLLFCLVVTIGITSPLPAQEDSEEELKTPLMRAYEELLNQSDLDDDETVDDLRKMIHDADEILARIKAENREAIRNINRQVPLLNPPHIMIILVDDLSPKYIGAYGSEKSLTPRLDQLAERSLVFKNFHSGSPRDAEAFWTLWTGRTADRITQRDPQTQLPQLATYRSTLLSNLWHAGYSTAFLGGWPLTGSLSVQEAQADLFIGWTPETQIHKVRPTEWMVNGQLRKKPDSEEATFAWTISTMQALAAWERHSSERPLATVIRYQGLEIPADIAGGDSNEQRTAVAFDRELGRLVDHLKTDSSTSNTLIWVIGETAQPGISVEAKSDEVGKALQSSQLQVPSILFYPRRPTGVADTRLSASYDVLPTLSTVVRDSRFVRSPNGESLLTNRQRRNSERLLYWSVPVGESRYQVARYGHWKAVVLPDAKSVQLFNLTSDPDQKHDVSDKHPEILQQVIRSGSKR